MDDKTPTPNLDRAGRARKGVYTMVALIAVIVILLDQLSKIWAERALADGQVIHLWADNLYFTLVYNSGAALSMGAGYTWLLSILQISIVTLALWWVRRVDHMAWLWAAGLLIGGAIGNIIDRLFREPGFLQGHVVDFIGYFDWFVGNVADIAITVAGVMIVALAIFQVQPSFGDDKDTGPIDSAEESSDGLPRS